MSNCFEKKRKALRSGILRGIFRVLLFFIYFSLNLCFAGPTQRAQLMQFDSLFQKTKDNDPKLSFYAATQILEISEVSNDAVGLAKGETYLGMYYNKKGQNNAAIYHFERSVGFYQRNKNLVGKGLSLMSLGQCYLDLGMLDSSLKYYYQSFQCFDKSNDAKSQIMCLASIGLVDEYRGDLHNAMANYQNANALQKKQNRYQDAGYIYRGIGILYFKQHNYKKALSYYDSSLQAYHTYQNDGQAASTYANIGIVWSDSGQYDKAFVNYFKALSIVEHLGDKKGIAEALINVGIAFNDKAGTTNDKRDFQSAIIYYSQALPICLEIHANPILKEVYHNLSTSYSNLGRYDSAYIYYDKYDSIKDFIVNEHNNNALADMLTKYETEKKEQQRLVAVAQATLSTHKLYYTSIGFVLILIIAGVVFLFYRQRVRSKELIASKNEQIQNQKIDELLKREEIKSFQSMIEGQELERKRIAEDLHDGLGILLSTVKLHFGSIEDRLNRQMDAQEQFVKGASLLDEALVEVRRIAHNMSTGILTHIGLVPALEDLKDTIEASRKIKVNLFAHNIEGRLDALKEITIYRIIQELISNILKHAQATEISINLNRNLQTNILSIMIEDDGKGFDLSQIPEGKGMGLRNMASRAERLNGTFHIESNKGNGTTAIIEIPV